MVFTELNGVRGASLLPPPNECSQKNSEIECEEWSHGNANERGTIIVWIYSFIVVIKTGKIISQLEMSGAFEFMLYSKYQIEFIFDDPHRAKMCAIALVKRWLPFTFLFVLIFRRYWHLLCQPPVLIFPLLSIIECNELNAR